MKTTKTMKLLDCLMVCLTVGCVTWGVLTLVEVVVRFL